MFSQPISVLIINDDKQDRLTIRHYLSTGNKKNYQIFEASSGKKALETLKTVRVDGVILDFHLSDMDGVEFLQQLQNHFFSSTFAVIILTEVGNESRAMQAMKNGAQDYLIQENLTRYNLQKSLYLAIERVKIRRKLEQSEQRFRGTFEQAAAAAMVAVSSGAVSDFTILEDVDLNGIAKTAQKMASSYKEPGK